MKIKVRFNRRYSFFVTLMACAFALWMMVRNFGLPLETLYKFAVMVLICLLAILIVAAPLAYVIRLIANRRERE